MVDLCVCVSVVALTKTQVFDKLCSKPLFFVYIFASVFRKYQILILFIFLVSEQIKCNYKQGTTLAKRDEKMFGWEILHNVGVQFN